MNCRQKSIIGDSEWLGDIQKELLCVKKQGKAVWEWTVDKDMDVVDWDELELIYWEVCERLKMKDWYSMETFLLCENVRDRIQWYHTEFIFDETHESITDEDRTDIQFWNQHLTPLFQKTLQLKITSSRIQKYLRTSAMYLECLLYTFRYRTKDIRL